MQKRGRWVGLTRNRPGGGAGGRARGGARVRGEGGRAPTWGPSLGARQPPWMALIVDSGQEAPEKLREIWTPT